MRVAIICLLILAACAQQSEVVREAIQQPEAAQVTGVPKGNAVLSVSTGTVLVNSKPGVVGMVLNEGDVVSTSAGFAEVRFFDDAVLRVDENTEFIVKKVSSEPRVVKLSQTSGGTWSRVLRMSGVKEYEIETPNTVATVRGTGFSVVVENNQTVVGVVEGAVHVAIIEDDVVVEEALVEAGSEAQVDEEIVVEELVVDEWITENTAADEQFIDEEVDEFIAENPNLDSELIRDIATGSLTDEEKDQLTDEQKEILEEKGISTDSDGQGLFVIEENVKGNESSDFYEDEYRGSEGGDAEEASVDASGGGQSFKYGGQ